MSVIGLLLLLLVGAICGAIAQAVIGFRAGGLLVSTIVGFLGAVIGTWLARVMGLPSLLAVNIEGRRIEILWAILGSIVLVGIVSAVQRASYRRSRYA